MKPANFLIVNGTLKLIDFGIASRMDQNKTHVTKDNQLGTLNFMSPESIQVENQPDKIPSLGGSITQWFAYLLPAQMPQVQFPELPKIFRGKDC